MRQVSAAFLEALRGSHRSIARVRVLTTYQTGTNPTGTELEIITGDVRLTADAAIRATLDVTVLGSWPTTAARTLWPLAPYGNELYVERGVDFSNGQVEWVGQGYFRINTVDQTVVTRNDREQSGIRISGSDRMAGIIDARLTEPRQFPATATYGDVFDTLVPEVYPAAVVVWDDGLATTALGRQVVCEQDRYAFLRDLVDSRGKVFYWDHLGRPLVRTPPAATVAVWDINEGENGVLVSLARELAREDAYNAVVATGQAADTTSPARAVVIDDNPLSPTYYYGRFGKVPRFYSSPLLLTAGQATDAATAILARVLGLPYSVSFGVIPNPALEPFDPVQVTTHLGREIHGIRELIVPLGPEQPMTATTRQASTGGGI